MWNVSMSFWCTSFVLKVPSTFNRWNCSQSFREWVSRVIMFSLAQIKFPFFPSKWKCCFQVHFPFVWFFSFLSPERPLFSLVLEQSHPSLKIMSVVWTSSDKVHGGYSASWWTKVFQFIIPTVAYSLFWAQHPSCLSQWIFFFQYHRCSSGRSFYFRCW